MIRDSAGLKYWSTVIFWWKYLSTVKISTASCCDIACVKLGTQETLCNCLISILLLTSRLLSREESQLIIHFKCVWRKCGLVIFKIPVVTLSLCFSNFHFLMIQQYERAFISNIFLLTWKDINDGDNILFLFCWVGGFTVILFLEHTHTLTSICLEKTAT